MAQLSTYYIGGLFANAPNAQAYFKDPRDAVPSNYKDPVKITDYAAKVRERQLESGRKYAMTGMLHTVVILDENGNNVFQLEAKQPPQLGQVALPFMHHMISTFPSQFADELRFGDSDPDALFFGFNIKQILKVAAFEAHALNLLQPKERRQRVPVRFWYNPLGAYDPRTVLLRSPEDGDIDFEGVLRFFGVNDSLEALVDSAELQAAIAAELVDKAQLVSTLVAETA